jgi:hypothetical protein
MVQRIRLTIKGVVEGGKIGGEMEPRDAHFHPNYGVGEKKEERRRTLPNLRLSIGIIM